MSSLMEVRNWRRKKEARFNLVKWVLKVDEIVVTSSVDDPRKLCFEI